MTKNFSYLVVLTTGIRTTLNLALMGVVDLND